MTCSLRNVHSGVFHAVAARGHVVAGAIVVALLSASCVRNPPPVEPEPTAPPPGARSVDPAPPSPPPLPEPPPLPPPPLAGEDDFASRTLEELNRESPLEPIFFGYDNSGLNAVAQSIIEANAGVIERFPTWVVTIEGHCDERGTPEYNLGLGERRALAVREYLVELGLPVAQLRTVSYGKEFPFDPGHDDSAWASNRRAHFVITSK